MKNETKNTTILPKKSKKKQNRYNNSLCDESMSFDECELAILRNAVDVNEQTQDKLKKENLIKGEELSAIFNILEKFIIKKTKKNVN